MFRPTKEGGKMLRSKCPHAIIFLTAFALLAVFAAHSAFAQKGVNTYGYFSVNYQETGDAPDGSNDPGEFSFPHLNLMMQSKLSDNFRVYLNLSGDGGENIDVRNYWGEYAAADYLKFRMGKVYRHFDLFNEKLDAVPTYLGIEPPELWDKDHLMLPRTGIFMVHGSVAMNSNMFKYSITTGNKEVIDKGKPISWDFNYNIGYKTTFGTSGYYSKEQGSPIAVGEGSPPGGILPWMAKDKYTVLGGYLKTQWKAFTVEAAYWTADHKAVRDPESVVMLLDAGLNDRQMQRFGLDTYDPNNPADVSMIKTNGDYTINTYYARFGYTIPGGTIKGISWEMTPFFFLDWYENAETIAKKKFGGDNEAGVADDGKFLKPTLGIALKPIPAVAFKFDASSHMYKWTNPENPGDGSKNVHYEEFRVDLSYYFE